MMRKIWRSPLFWFGVVCAILAFAIGYPTHKNMEHNEYARAVSPAIKCNATQLVQFSDLWLDSLYKNIGNWVELDGVATEYYVLQRSERYKDSNVRIGDLEMTAAWDSDTAVMVARPLMVNGLGQNKAAWTSCDSAISITHQLYNFTEFTEQLYIEVCVDQFIDGLNSNDFFYGGNCMEYLGHRKAYKRSLENFCYNNVTCKAILREIKREKNKLTLILNCGLITQIQLTEFTLHIKE